MCILVKPMHDNKNKQMKQKLLEYPFIRKNWQNCNLYITRGEDFIIAYITKLSTATSRKDFRKKKKWSRQFVEIVAVPLHPL